MSTDRGFSEHSYLVNNIIYTKIDGIKALLKEKTDGDTSKALFECLETYRSCIKNVYSEFHTLISD